MIEQSLIVRGHLGFTFVLRCMFISTHIHQQHLLYLQPPFTSLCLRFLFIHDVREVLSKKEREENVMIHVTLSCSALGLEHRWSKVWSPVLRRADRGFLDF